MVYYTRTPNDVIFEELIYVLLFWVEEMNFHIWISDGIQTDSLGKTRQSDGLVHTVNVLILVIVIHLFRSSNHRIWKIISKSRPLIFSA